MRLSNEERKSLEELWRAYNWADAEVSRFIRRMLWILLASATAFLTYVAVFTILTSGK